ncbi:MAG: Lrp/AsnC family transcriptional regulator [Candidatus Heimdallarchaeota archaeon]|nr:Lrp/AsnC family transcriptional regulator [Candidatus Heimdallarchaeota archaeon]
MSSISLFFAIILRKSELKLFKVFHKNVTKIVITERQGFLREKIIETKKEMTDETDLRILEILKKNSREKHVAIAEQVGLTEGAVRRRIDKMVESGTIISFTLESKLEFEAIVLIKAGDTKIIDIKAKIEPIVERMYELAGDYDIAAHIQAFSMEKLNTKIDAIRKISGISDTKTLIKLVD